MPLTKIHLKWTEAWYWVVPWEPVCLPSLSLNVAEPHSCQLSPAFFNQTGLKAPSTPCLGVGQTLAPGPAKLLIWGSQSSKSLPRPFPSLRTPDLVLQVSKAAWLDSVGRNSACQDSSARCCKCFPPLCHSQIPRGVAHRVPCDPHSVRSESGLPQSHPQFWGGQVSPRLSSLLEEPGAQGRPLYAVWQRPAGQWGQYMAAPLIPPEQPVLPWWCRGTSVSPQFYHSPSGTLFLNRC